MRHFLSVPALCGTLLIGCSTETATTPAQNAPPAGDIPASQDVPTPDSESAGNVFALSGDNTKVTFLGTKKSGDSQAGGFQKLSGKITLAEGLVSGISVVIETDSLYSSVDRLTGHLKNEDFFSVKEFPELRFQSTKVEGENTVTVTGDLTMHGQTNEISFPASVEVSAGQVNLLCEFKVDRTRFGMNYTGQPNDPINADVDIKIVVGQASSESGSAPAADDSDAEK